MNRALSPAMTKMMMPIPIQPHAVEAFTVTLNSIVLSDFSPFDHDAHGIVSDQGLSGRFDGHLDLLQAIGLQGIDLLRLERDIPVFRLEGRESEFRFTAEPVFFTKNEKFAGFPAMASRERIPVGVPASSL